MIILSHIKTVLCLAECPHKKIKNMHAVCHGCNTKIASTEGESSHYYWRSTQEVQLVSIFCSSFHPEMEKSQTNLNKHATLPPNLITVTPNSTWAPDKTWHSQQQTHVVQQCSYLRLTIMCSLCYTRLHMVSCLMTCNGLLKKTCKEKVQSW